MNMRESASLGVACGLPLFMIGLVWESAALSAVAILLLGVSVAISRHVAPTSDRPRWPTWKLATTAALISIAGIFILDGYAVSGIPEGDAAASLMLAMCIPYFAMYLVAFRISRFTATALSGLAILAGLACGIAALYVGFTEIEKRGLQPADYPFDTRVSALMFFGSLSLGVSMAVEPVTSWARRRELAN